MLRVNRMSLQFRPNFGINVHILTCIFLVCHYIVITPYPIYHYNDVIMGAITSQITSLAIVYSTVCSDADQRKHQSSASLAFVWGIHRWPVNSPHQWPVTRKMFPFDDVIMIPHICGDRIQLVPFGQQHTCYHLSSVCRSLCCMGLHVNNGKAS